MVCILFGVMNLGALLGFSLDRQSHRALLSRLQSDGHGFRELRPAEDFKTGSTPVWLWSFVQEPLLLPLEQPKGTAVRLSNTMGVPFIRLRMLLPEELFRGSVSQAVGRRDGISVKALSHHAPVEDAVFAAIRRKQGAAESLRRVHSLHSLRRPSEKEPAGDDDCGEFCGTALVFSFLTVERVLDAEELYVRLQAAAVHFKDVHIPGLNKCFLEVYTILLGVWAESGVCAVRHWLEKARLLRFVLLQRSDGSWECSESLAQALDAREGPNPPRVPATGLAGMIQRSPILTLLFDTAFDTGDFEEDLEEKTENGDREQDDNVIPDCPLTTSSLAIVTSVPLPLRQAMLEKCSATALDGVSVEQIWATAVSLATLAGFDACWIADELEMQESTIVDQGIAFLDGLAHKASKAGMHHLVELIESDELTELAERECRRWRAKMRANKLLVREHTQTLKYQGTGYFHRSLFRILSALQSNHEVFATFLDRRAVIMRWQRFMVLITLVLEALLISIWFFSSKGNLCCAELARVLGCSSAAACRGVHGTCSTLQSQLAGVYGPFTYPDGTQHDVIDDYVCQQFPDDDSVRDTAIVALISVAVSIPVIVIINWLFMAANHMQEPCSQITGAEEPIPKVIHTLLFGKEATKGWQYVEPRTRAQRVNALLRWWMRFGSTVKMSTWLARKLRRAGVQPASGDLSEACCAIARKAEARRRTLIFVGVLGTYAIWAVFTWFIFTNGQVIYQTLGPESEASFGRQFGINYVADQLAMWKDVLQEAVDVCLIGVVFDLLRMTTVHNWYEGFVDLLSLQSSLYDGAARSIWQVAWKMTTRQWRVVME